MRAISHGWTPTTPAIHPADGEYCATARTHSKKTVGFSS